MEQGQTIKRLESELTLTKSEVDQIKLLLAQQEFLFPTASEEIRHPPGTIGSKARAAIQ